MTVVKQYTATLGDCTRFKNCKVYMYNFLNSNEQISAPELHMGTEAPEVRQTAEKYTNILIKVGTVDFTVL